MTTCPWWCFKPSNVPAQLCVLAEVLMCDSSQHNSTISVLLAEQSVYILWTVLQTGYELQAVFNRRRLAPAQQCVLAEVLMCDSSQHNSTISVLLTEQSVYILWTVLQTG
jgi:predicted membrane protein